MADDKLEVKGYRIQRTYYRNSKYSLVLFIPPCETQIVGNGYNCNPMGILYFTLPWVENGVNRSFEIRQHTQRKILRKLSEAINWFDSIEDLFVVSENELFFNTKYSDLAVKYRSEETGKLQGMKIIPIAVDTGGNRSEEGVMIFVNDKANFIILTREELQELFDLILGFNFAAEIQVTFQALLLTYMTGRVGESKKLYNDKFLK